MKVGIIQVDGKKYNGQLFPNIALMKIASYHKGMGDQVEWWKGPMWNHEYEKVYASKIFSYSDLPNMPEQTVIGGTGIDFYNVLPSEIESQTIDYSIYPECDFHVGFSMKGCRFNCKFCCVPKKEGRPYNYNCIDELLINPIGGNRLMLLDNDFFGGSNWKANLERIIELNLKVCFAQGLNIRIITPEQAALLAKCRYVNIKFNQKYLSFAWDKYGDRRLIDQGIKICNDAGIPCRHMQFFVLIGFDTSESQDLERIEHLRGLGCMPFVMPYNKSNRYQAALARYVNHRATFKSCTWEQYKFKN